jgi:hypothetical protein
MYHSNMIRIYRSPEAGEGGGSPAGAGAEGAGASGAGEGAPAGNSGAATPEYLSKADFESFRSEFQQTIQRLTPAERREQAAEGNKPGTPSKPDLNAYDFKKPGELDRYNLDNYKYLRHLDKQEEAKENETKAAEEKTRKDKQGHASRTSEYAKANPSYVADIKAAAGKINVNNPVASAIYGSKNGVLAVHYMAKNPGADQELNLLADTDGPDAVRERIGEMAAEMRAQSKALESNTLAAGQRPTRFNTRGAAGGGTRSKSAADRFADFNS